MEEGIKRKAALLGGLSNVVELNGDTANKFNEHLELILDFMGVLDHEPELMEKIKSSENTETKMNKI